MICVGVDLHKHTITLCVVDRERRILKRSRLHCCEPHRIQACFEELRQAHGAVSVVVEATAS